MKCLAPDCRIEVDTSWPRHGKKYCSKTCQKRVFRSKHRERLREEERSHRVDNHAAIRQREKASRARNVETHRAWGRNAWRRKQGLESTETKTGDCEICGKTAKRLHYDHDHVTGWHRGWLCPPCNMKLGWFEKWESQARRYLDKAASAFAAAAGR